MTRRAAIVLSWRFTTDGPLRCVNLRRQIFSSFAAYRAKQLKDGNGVFPESKLRQLFAANPDGTMGGYKSSGRVHRLIGEGQKKRTYAGIRVPALAFFDDPRAPGDPQCLTLLAPNGSHRVGARCASRRGKDGGGTSNDEHRCRHADAQDIKTIRHESGAAERAPCPD